MSDLTIGGKTFDFLAVLTALVVLLYVGASAWAFISGSITFQDFSTAVGPMSGMLIGYWIKGQA
jgi:hypothetical protein